MVVLPFDAHNHVHMGPSPPQLAWSSSGAWQPPKEDAIDSSNSSSSNSLEPALSGMALMSTHPRDFPRVQSLAQTLPHHPVATGHSTPEESTPFAATTTTTKPLVVPCYGVHPWFLHELSVDDWAPISTTSNGDPTTDAPGDPLVPLSSSPHWLTELEQYLRADPHAIVGEIGLDGFHYHATTKELTTPLPVQVQALEWQLHLAHLYQRPVSVHAVHCMGPLLTCLTKFRKIHQLPPKLYFHAFGGKVGTVDQLLAACGDKPSNHDSKPSTFAKKQGTDALATSLQEQPPRRQRPKPRVYFGFAPIVSKCPTCVCVCVCLYVSLPDGSPCVPTPPTNSQHILDSSIARAAIIKQIFVRRPKPGTSPSRWDWNESCWKRIMKMPHEYLLLCNTALPFWPIVSKSPNRSLSNKRPKMRSTFIRWAPM